MRMIQIESQSVDSAKDMCEKMLHYGGKLMSALEEMCESENIGERTNYRMGNRGGRMGERDEDYWDNPEMGERRGVRGTGRYSRY